MTMAITDSDRKAIGDFFRQYGEAWKDGLEVLERDYDVTISGTGGKYRLDCTPKSIAGWDVQIKMSIGKHPMMTSFVKIPDGEEPSQPEKDLVDRMLVNLKQVWVLDPVMINPVKMGHDTYSSPDVPIIVDLARGVDGFRDHYNITWRKRKEHPVLYLSAKEDPWESFSIGFDPKKGRILELVEKTVPQEKIKFLSPEEYQEIETALKKYGNFGVYGRVDRDLELLQKEFNVSIDVDPFKIRVRLWPYSSGGHSFSFSIDRKTGMINDVFVGELH